MTADVVIKIFELLNEEFIVAAGLSFIVSDGGNDQILDFESGGVPLALLEQPCVAGRHEEFHVATYGGG